MDIQDVSSLSQYASFMKMTFANAERSRRRKGETPRDHPPAQVLVLSFMMKIYANPMNARDGMTNAILTSQVPLSYLPCTQPAAELVPLSIARMQLETHHRGRRTVVRVLTPPDRMTAVMAIVEDVEGTAVLMQLYHQPGEDTMPAGDILYQGRLVLLKDPYLKVATDGRYSLRVDHVSDVIFLENTDELVPERWRQRKRKVIDSGLGITSRDIRMRGNDAVGMKDWAMAENLYASAIETATNPEDEQLARLNRSLANLRLGRPASALSDAIQAHGDKNAGPNEKALFREASALYELHKFDQCLEVLDSLASSFPSNEAVKPMMARVRKRLHEQKTGDYDFQHMHRQARATPPLIDCATYAAPVEIRQSPGRGRGLFTTRRISAGELLLCEKAFGYVFAEDGSAASNTILMNMNTKRVTMGGHANLITQLVQKLYHDLEAAQSFAKLHHGDYKAALATEVDGRPIVDTFLVADIMALNCFGCGRSTLSTKKTVETDRLRSHFTTGVWLLASYINHSCISNCQRSFIGDMQIIRATKDLEANTELFFWYQGPEAAQSYAETQEKLANWGFKCGCTLCLAKKATPMKAIQKRKTLLAAFRRAMGDKFNTRINVTKVKQLLEQMDQTYSATEKKLGAVRYELWDPYFGLSKALLMDGNPSEATEMAVRGLEALGFLITACPPRLSPELRQGQPEFRINQWGLVINATVGALLLLFQAYEQLAPELSAVVKGYVEVAHSIDIGEKESILDMYPQLAENWAAW